MQTLSLPVPETTNKRVASKHDGEAQAKHRPPNPRRADLAVDRCFASGAVGYTTGRRVRSEG